MKAVQQLQDIVAKLRAPGGCPWDRAQTLTSLTPCIIEEAYELVSALESDNTQDIVDECGDFLLQVIMIATIAQEEKRFDLASIAKSSCEKMIRRHPHVFSTQKIDTVDEVVSQWESIKQTETVADSVMDTIPNLPALLKAQKIQKKASKVGFDWPDTAGAWNKVDEELNEFKHELNGQNNSKREEEAGDLLFALVNVLRRKY